MVFLRLSTHSNHEDKRDVNSEERTKKRHKNVLHYFSIFKQEGNDEQNLQTLPCSCQENYKPGDAHEKTARSGTLCSIPNTKFLISFFFPIEGRLTDIALGKEFEHLGESIIYNSCYRLVKYFPLNL